MCLLHSVSCVKANSCESVPSISDLGLLWKYCKFYFVLTKNFGRPRNENDILISALNIESFLIFCKGRACVFLKAFFTIWFASSSIVQDSDKSSVISIVYIFRIQLYQKCYFLNLFHITFFLSCMNSWSIIISGIIFIMLYMHSSLFIVAVGVLHVGVLGMTFACNGCLCVVGCSVFCWLYLDCVCCSL